MKQAIKTQFLLMGVGPRRKLMYCGGQLVDLQAQGVVRTWDVAREEIHVDGTRVELQTRAGQRVVICCDHDAVWVEEEGQRRAITRERVHLPTFAGHPHAAALRMLHHEILLCILGGVPLPNFLAYAKPRYRDASMICMVLQKTGNLHLVANWIRSLRDPFDRHNAGVCEPDNLGQVLYMVSLVSGASHPIVDTVLRAVKDFRTNKHIAGQTDFAAHPVYQTKWLKFGLRSLGLDDPYEIPRVADSYAGLFWMDFRHEHQPGEMFSAELKARSPCLAWAEAHFHHAPPPLQLGLDGRYPLTWESHAAQADYQKMASLGAHWPAERICAPHAWHAAEMFLYLHGAG